MRYVPPWSAEPRDRRPDTGDVAARSGRKPRPLPKQTTSGGEGSSAGDAPPEAAIANMSASLRYHGIDAALALAPWISGAVLILGGLIAGTALMRSKGCPPYALVFLWALAAIFAKGGEQSPIVAIACALAAILSLQAPCQVGAAAMATGFADLPP